MNHTQSAQVDNGDPARSSANLDRDAQGDPDEITHSDNTDDEDLSDDLDEMDDESQDSRDSRDSQDSIQDDSQDSQDSHGDMDDDNLALRVPGAGSGNSDMPIERSGGGTHQHMGPGASTPSQNLQNSGAGGNHQHRNVRQTGSGAGGTSGGRYGHSSHGNMPH